MTSADMAQAVVASPGPRRGGRRWVRGYLTMLWWHMVSLRMWAAVTLAVEILGGVGLVLGIGLLIPHIDARAALYATTGAGVVALLLIGLVLCPQLVAQQKTAGSYEYLLTLPPPRTAAALAWFTLTLLVGVPAAVATIVAGVLRYGVPLSVSPMLIPAVLLTVFTATMLGYALAHAIPRPMVTVLATQLFVLVAFGYAPVNFPADQMPAWLVELNRGLPFLPMATVVRSALTRAPVTDVGTSYAVLGAWAAGAVALAALALGRRR